MPYSYYNLQRDCGLDDFAWWAGSGQEVTDPCLT